MNRATHSAHSSPRPGAISARTAAGAPGARRTGPIPPRPHFQPSSRSWCRPLAALGTLPQASLHPTLNCAPLPSPPAVLSLVQAHGSVQHRDLRVASIAGQVCCVLCLSHRRPFCPYPSPFAGEAGACSFAFLLVPVLQEAAAHHRRTTHSPFQHSLLPWRLLSASVLAPASALQRGIRGVITA
jgi:hypothetical protein